ncbi:MAG: DUF1998 domain-containing protein [Gammaproteobacteria bacterium]|nr:DUF1998 domain-containing protein [Gammaproteobacteria bacterium]
MTFSREQSSIRPSQAARTFGPGSIYDNQSDSMLIMGLNYWDEGKFKVIEEPLLMHEIKKGGLQNLERLVSVSSFADPEIEGTIPVMSFPTWGFCPKCNKLVSNRNNKTGIGMKCDSVECTDRKKNGIPIPETYPVRFVVVCDDGHLDEFPWYRWIHTTDEQRKNCEEDDAKMYLLDDSSSLSLNSKKLECRNNECTTNPISMENALSPTGLLSRKIYCSGWRPWMGEDRPEGPGNCKKAHTARGIFKGATNMYFPIIRSAVTIPPFSSMLSKELIKNRIRILENMKQPDFDTYLEMQFDIKCNRRPDGNYTLDQVKKMVNDIEKYQDNDDMNVFKLEFNELGSTTGSDKDDFVSETLAVRDSFSNIIDKITLVKKIRVVSALIGFTRLDTPDDKNSSFSPLGKGKIAWLPVVENRGEGIFLSFNTSELQKWETNDSVMDRFHDIMSKHGRAMVDLEDHRHSPRYVFLHTFSHMLIKTISNQAGYSTASLSERIYCGNDMAGILIFTASSSSDGALGGLTALGDKNDARIWNILGSTIDQSTVCSNDPLCSMRAVEKTTEQIGAACHACALLPETCCETMNMFLDRELIKHTLSDKNTGFLSHIGN